MVVRTGISSVLAYIVLIGVTLAIIIGFISYTMGTWSNQGTYSAILVYPDTKIDPERKVLILHIINRGSVTAVIYKISIQNIESLNISIVIRPGEEITVEEHLSGIYKPGQSYVIEIYTKEGDVFKQPIYIPVKAE